MGNFVIVHNDDGTAATAVALSGSSTDTLRGDGSVGCSQGAWPVGSVFTSVVATNPATLLGYGTWAAIAAGRVLVGLDANDTDFDVVEETGGAKTKALSAHSGTAVADHAAHTHAVTSNVAVADHASHTHSVTAAGTNSAPTFTGSASTAGSTTAAPKLVTGNTSTGVAPVVTPAGTVSAPTFTGSAVTSGAPSATLSHTVTNNAVTSGNPSATLSHSVTQPANHADLNVVQPYFVVRFWVRTA